MLGILRIRAIWKLPFDYFFLNWLVRQVERLTFSVLWEMTPEAEIVDTKFCKARIWKWILGARVKGYTPNGGESNGKENGA